MARKKKVVNLNDLAELLESLASIGRLGAAAGPYARIRRQLGLDGYAGASQYAEALKGALIGVPGELIHDFGRVNLLVSELEGVPLNLLGAAREPIVRIRGLHGEPPTNRDVAELISGLSVPLSMPGLMPGGARDILIAIRDEYKLFGYQPADDIEKVLNG